MSGPELEDNRKASDFGSPWRTMLGSGMGLMLGMCLALLGEPSVPDLGESMIVGAFKGKGNTYWSYAAQSAAGEPCQLMPRVMKAGMLSVIGTQGDRVILKWIGGSTAFKASCGKEAEISTQRKDAARIFAYWQ